MKCTSKILLCLTCIVSVLITGCGTSTALTNEYDAYSYNHSYTNTDIDVNVDYYANSLCVTDTINSNTENTYASVAKGAGVFNLTTQEVLFNYNIFDQLHPASTTKILTAYIILKDCTLSDVVTVSEFAVDQEDDSSVCGLQAGDNITVNDLLYGLMLASGNDAAIALAEHHSGSVEEFAKVMTREAHLLGATNSQFQNPSGLTNKEHYTTVYDMYLIFNEALKNDKFVEIINSKAKTAVYSSANGQTVERTFYNTNRYFTGNADTPDGFQIIGGKTGTTYDAGYCLVLYSQNPEGDDIVSIVFKADGPHNLYLLMNQILNKFAK